MYIANYVIENTFVVTVTYLSGEFVCVIYLLQVEHISQQRHKKLQAPLDNLSMLLLW